MPDMMELIRRRHSVRSYTDELIDPETIERLKEEIDECNRESGLSIRLVEDGSEAFEGMLARYGRFSGVRTLIVLAGPKGGKLDELCGYYGERLVLKALGWGLQSCWVAGTFSRGKAKQWVDPGSKFVCVITIGHGETEGRPRKSKPAEKLFASECPEPDWFERAKEAVLLAPTGVNRQGFLITCTSESTARIEDKGSYTKADLGIVRYHFEQGAGEGTFTWEDGGLR